MSETQALFAALRQLADGEAVAAVERLKLKQCCGDNALLADLRRRMARSKGVGVLAFEPIRPICALSPQFLGFREAR
ncbi:hypothetical protein [Inquilinus sp. OTU3971]|uniref:hypothetical protein n=1 Tax=Inquilinus sp. OTU3971 TaxID=3043855 RepID=UPI00313ACFE1